MLVGTVACSDKLTVSRKLSGEIETPKPLVKIEAVYESRVWARVLDARVRIRITNESEKTVGISEILTITGLIHRERPLGYEAKFNLSKDDAANRIGSAKSDDLLVKGYTPGFCQRSEIRQSTERLSESENGQLRILPGGHISANIPLDELCWTANWASDKVFLKIDQIGQPAQIQRLFFVISVGEYRSQPVLIELAEEFRKSASEE